MYVEIAKIFLSAIFFRAINVFGTLTTFAYVLLSILLKTLKPSMNIPEMPIIYTAAAFMIYVAGATIYPGIRGERENLKTMPVNPLGLFMQIFSIGYLIIFIELNKYISFILTWAFFMALSMKKYNAAYLWPAVSIAAVVHSVFFSGTGKLFYPALYGIAYILITYFFDAAKGEFTFACTPEDLKEGMTPAETIVFDGSKYRFTSSPFPSVMGLVRYGTEDRIFKRRVVASFFSPLKKESIDEIRKAAKEYKKPVIFIQKRTDFMPFLIAGAMSAYILS